MRLRSQSSRQQLAAGVVEDKTHAATGGGRARPAERPSRIQIEAERILVFEHLKTVGTRVLRRGHDDKNGGGMPAGQAFGSPRHTTNSPSSRMGSSTYWDRSIAGGEWLAAISASHSALPATHVGGRWSSRG